MSFDRYYNLCNENMGQAVEITCHDGTIRRGIIERVDERCLYLGEFPSGGCDNDSQGYGMFAWGYGAGGYGGYGAGPIAWASIWALALLPFFFW